MASKRDLVEAHAYNRRRLVSAFLSGAPGGREVEPAKPARAVVGGAFLAVLVVAGSALFGYLRPGLPDDWNQNKLIVVEATGARFVATDDEVLYPVANTASARLLIPAESYGVVNVGDENLIAGEPIGQNLGIVGAPDHLPSGRELIQTGWTSCLDQQGSTFVQLADTPGAEPTTEVAKVVTAGQATFVLWGSLRYPVADDVKNPVLQALRLNGTAEQAVPGPWVDLFPEGPALAPVEVPGAGSRYPGDGAPDGAVVGSLLRVASVDGTERDYVLAAGGLVQMTPVATALYDISTSRQPTLEVTQAEVAGLPTMTRPLYEEAWPAQIPVPYADPVACALLEASADDLATVHLARPTSDSAVPAGGRGTAQVQNQRGALVRAVSGSATNRGTVFLVDSTARRFAFGAPIDEVTKRLGYEKTKPALVPIAWVNALADGPELSIEAARQFSGGSAEAG